MNKKIQIIFLIICFNVAQCMEEAEVGSQLISTQEVASLERIANELKQIIASKLANISGKERFVDALIDLKSLSAVNKEFRAIINNRYFLNSIIPILIKRSGYFPISVAIMLYNKNFKDPAIWLKDETIKNKELKELMNLHLVNSAILGNTKRVQFLIDAGADVNAKDENGTTALLRSSLQGKEKIVDLLIAAKADPNLVKSPIRTYNETPLMWAARSRSINIVKKLLLAGADVNAVTTFGNTALMEAIWVNSLEIIDILIKAGANVNEKNKRGFTVLSFAKRNLADAEYENNDQEVRISQEIINKLKDAGAK